MPACGYINLDDAAERRRNVEASFAAAAPAGWALERFSAVRPAAADHGGPVRAAVVGCFLSHRALLERHLADEEPLFIAEDDVAFSPATFVMVDRLLAQPHDWDILFTDVLVSDMALMALLARQRAEYAANPTGFHLHDLRDKGWSGATAYVVRGSAKRRLHELLSEADLTRPYDLYLRDLCNQGRLSAAFALPFLTSISSEAARSQIDSGSSRGWDEALHLFRRLMFVDRDMAALERDATALHDRAEPQGRVFGAVVGAVTSATFPLRR